MIMKSTEKQLKDAAIIVLNKLKECPLFCGDYDAKHGNKSFMYGISTVMETISYYADDEDFSTMFLDNMVNSEKKSRKI